MTEGVLSRACLFLAPTAGRRALALLPTTRRRRTALVFRVGVRFRFFLALLDDRIGPPSRTLMARLLRQRKAAERHLSRRLILRRERDELHVAHVERSTRLGVRRLKERIRANLVERNPNLLPHAAFQLSPRRVDDMVPIQERHRPSQWMCGLDLGFDRAPCCPVLLLFGALHVTSRRVAGR